MDTLGRSLLRRAARYLVTAIVVAPVALGWAISNTRVDELVGITPTTFTLTTSGHSELRLGIAGTVFVPQHRGPFGLVATVNGPADASLASADLASYVSPQMLELYSGLFHDPEAAIGSYVDLLSDELIHQVQVAELVLTLGVGSLALVLWRWGGLRGRAVSHRRLRVGLVVVAMLAASAGLGLAQVRAAEAGSRPAAGRYPLTALDATPAEGATTNSPILRLVLGDAVPKVNTLVDRQEAAVAAYLDQATEDLQAQVSQVATPGDGAVAVLMQSDVHCNTTMIRLQKEVRKLLQGASGGDAPVAMGVTGDLTTNGTPTEGGCIRDEAAIGRPAGRGGPGQPRVRHQRRADAASCHDPAPRGPPRGRRHHLPRCR